jgi:hypothetical protein
MEQPKETVKHLFSVGENHKAIQVEKLGSAVEEAIKYFEAMEFTTCCSGKDCGCMGSPLEPEYYILRNLKEARDF